jgi:DNA-binding response OmpR family regulator
MPKILLLEDDFLIAFDMKAHLEEAGFEIVGPFARNEDAAEHVASGALDAAVLDMDLGGQDSFPTASGLQARDIPFVFVSGNDRAELPSGLAECPVHTKPVVFSVLIEDLSDVIARG